MPVDGLSEDEYVALLREELRQQRYRPGRPVRLEIPKVNGSRRVVFAPSFKDKVVQIALLQVVQPVLEPALPDSLHGFRRKRGVRTAIQAITQLVNEDYHWAVCIDIRDCFDSVNRELLRKQLEEKIGNPRVLRLVDQIVTYGRPGTRLGVPQGAPMSPLLLNVYLTALVERVAQGGDSRRMVAYADDLIVLSKSRQRAKRSIGLVRTALAELGLEPNSKRFMGEVDLDHRSVEYLGLVVSRPMKVDEGVRRCHVQPSPRAWEHLGELHGNQSVEGWHRYYGPLTG